MSGDGDARSAAMLNLREKAIYSGIESASLVVSWFWSEVARRSAAERAVLHRALFAEPLVSNSSSNSNGGAANNRIQELRVMSAGEDSARLITCNALVHVLLLPIYASQDIFQRRFDESLAAAFKKQRTALRDSSSLSMPPAVNPSSSSSSSSGSAILRRHSIQSGASQQPSLAPPPPVPQASLVRQGLVKFESQTKLALPVSTRPISLQQRLQLDQTLRNPTPPAAPQPQPPLPPQQQLPTPSPAVTRTSPRSPSIAVGLSRAPPPTAPRASAPTVPTVPPSPKAPPPPTSSAEVSAPPLPLSKSPGKLSNAAIAAPANADDVIVAAPVKPQPPPGSPTKSMALAARPPVPSTRPPPPRQARDDSLTGSNGGAAKSFSDALAKPPKPASTSPRTPSERSSRDDRDEIALQRAAQAEAQRVENERQTERNKKLARLDERQKPIFELIVTEEDYCRWLITHMCFVDSLRRHRVLTDDEINEVFPFVAELKDSSGALVRAFAAAGEGVFERVGEIFVRAFDASAQSAMYESVAAQEVAAAKLQQLLTSNEEFARHCRKARYEVETALTDVQSMQIKPFQRLTKYPLLFRAILAATPVASPDYASLGEAAAVVGRVLKQVDELRETRERREKALQLEQRITGASSTRGSDAAPGGGSAAVANADELRNVRVLLHEGEVTLLDDAGTERDVHMFLFSDMVMFARTTSKFQRKVMGDKSFRMHDELPLTASCIVAESRRPGLTHAFDICCVVNDANDIEPRVGASKRRGPRKATLICSTHVEVAAWLYALETAIAAIKKADADADTDAQQRQRSSNNNNKSKRASAGGALPPMVATDDDDAESAAAVAKKRVKKRRASAGGAAGESVGRLERQLLGMQKTRDGLVKLVQFYREDPPSAAEATTELAELDAAIASLRQRIASARK